MHTWDASTCDWRPNVKVSRHAPVSRNRVPTFGSDWKNPETQAPVSSLPRLQTWSANRREIRRHRFSAGRNTVKQILLLRSNLCVYLRIYAERKGRVYFKLTWNDFLHYFPIFYMTFKSYLNNVFLSLSYILNNQVVDTVQNSFSILGIQSQVLLPDSNSEFMSSIFLILRII